MCHQLDESSTIDELNSPQVHMFPMKRKTQNFLDF